MQRGINTDCLRVFWQLGLLLSLTSIRSLSPVAVAQRTTGPERFERAIQAFEQADVANPPPRNPTLFVGASNIRRWESLARDFKNTAVINRGFGGAWLRDVLHYADRVIFPYEPKSIVLQAGGNDLNGGRSPEEVLADFRALRQKIHERLPMATLTVLSIPPVEARWTQVDSMRRVNRLIQEEVAVDPRVSFINLFDSMLTDLGLPRVELFTDDKLHVNGAGYELWTSLVRWDAEIRALEAADRKNQPAPGGIVFIGSSSIKRWTTLADDFSGLNAVNHGFGGSQIFDSVVFARRLVTPLQPRMVVFYAGSNDLHSGKSAARVLGDFQSFVRTVHRRLPLTRIAFISIAGNPARWSEVDEVKAANKLVEQFTQTDSRLMFIDVFPHMMGPDGLPQPDIFVADRLHMNRRGYEIWTSVVRPFLDE